MRCPDDRVSIIELKPANCKQEIVENSQQLESGVCPDNWVIGQTNKVA
jgi:hypothetical protein